MGMVVAAGDRDIVYFACNRWWNCRPVHGCATKSDISGFRRLNRAESVRRLSDEKPADKDQGQPAVAVEDIKIAATPVPVEGLKVTGPRKSRISRVFSRGGSGGGAPPSAGSYSAA